MRWIRTKISNRTLVIAYDITAIPLAWFLSYWCRYDMASVPVKILSSSFYAIAVVALVQVATYFRMGLYRGLWRFSSIPDVIKIIKATSVATFVAIPILYFSSVLVHVPRTIVPLYLFFLISILCGGRLLMRWYKDRKVFHQGQNPRVLIVGAGQAGESLVRDIQRHSQDGFTPVGFVDDRASKRGQEIHGVRVLGNIRSVSSLVTKHNIDLIFIALPSVSGASMRRIVKDCEATKLPLRTLPSLHDLAAGKVEMSALREVALEDLIGRSPVSLEWGRIEEHIKQHRVLVTGGGGSIGSELCRQIASLNPKSLCVLDHSEFNLYSIQQELSKSYPNLNIEIALLNITDSDGMDHIMGDFLPEIVFHAAAYKHVPMLESQARTAVNNNIFGTINVAQAAVKNEVKQFVMISTDKAVNPTNVMGASKRVAEIYCQNLNARVKTQFITVRFGNVLGSAGSVVPLFKQQLKKGGPLTVTHPDITRYFMTIPEASQLILQAAIQGLGGEIFVLDMGDAVKIDYLAKQMIRLSGKEPGVDVEIEYTGLRAGEKLYEELFHESEALAETSHEKIMKARARTLEWSELLQSLEQMRTASNNYQQQVLLDEICKLVPEYNGSVQLGNIA